jgi:DNA-binding winged helix-turn-helix (wHTH) protein
MKSSYEINKPDNSLYEFGQFQVNPIRRLLLQGRNSIRLERKIFDTLLVLIESGGRIVSKEELMDKIWPDTAVEESALTKNISLLRKTLGENAGTNQYIATVTGQGYRFVAPVKEVKELADHFIEKGIDLKKTSAGDDKPDDGTADKILKVNLVPLLDKLLVSALRRPFGGYYLHVCIACVLYAALYGIAMFVEIAYEFDQYSVTITRKAGLATIWILVTAMLGLWADWWVTMRGKTFGVVISIAVFLLAIVLLHLAVMLPPVPITLSKLQTHTAQAAYIKTSVYCFTLALFFLLIPFHFIISIHHQILTGRQKTVRFLLADVKHALAPPGAIYLKLWMLSIAIGVFLIMATLGSAHLIDNLITTPSMNLFMIFYLVRLILFFSLGLQCFAWYYKTLNDFKKLIVKNGISDNAN